MWTGQVAMAQNMRVIALALLQRIAQAWQDMAHWTEQRDVVAPSPSAARVEHD